MRESSDWDCITFRTGLRMKTQFRARFHQRNTNLVAMKWSRKFGTIVSHLEYRYMYIYIYIYKPVWPCDIKRSTTLKYTWSRLHCPEGSVVTWKRRSETLDDLATSRYAFHLIVSPEIEGRPTPIRKRGSINRRLVRLCIS